MENSIAVFILRKSVRNEGRKTFAQYMLISIACADILTTLVYYPAIFVQFSHEFVWLVQGRIGDILCKLYYFLVNLPDKVVRLSLIGLACDVVRNSSSKGRKEHTKKFIIVVTTLLWIAASGFSAVYLGISKVQISFNECRSTETNSQFVFMLNLMFVVSASIILAILNIVVFIRVKRRVREMKERKRREREMAKPHSKTGRHRHITHKTDRKMQHATSRKCRAKDREPPSMGSEILSEMASAKEKENALGNTEASVTDSKTTAVNEVSKTQAKRKEPRKVKSKNDVNDVEARDSENVITGQSEEGKRFQTTRNEAKTMAAVSIPFIILLIVFSVVLPFVCFSCSMYVLYVVLMVGEMGWRSGRALAFHQCGPGSIPGLGVISGLSLLVLYSAPRGFSPGTPVFPSPQKLTFDLI